MSIIKTLMKMLAYGNSKAADCSVCEKDKKYLTERIETLTQQMSVAIGPIEITEGYANLINPYDKINAPNMICADAGYLTYSLEDWKTILARLHISLVDNYTWTEEIFDCDDVALLYASILSYSAYSSGLSKQPAFAIAWSNTHAFNVFIDSDNKTWVFEPQTGQIIGRLGETTGHYDVKRVWFIG